MAKESSTTKSSSSSTSDTGKKKNNTVVIIVIIVAVLLMCCVCGGVGYYFLTRSAGEGFRGFLENAIEEETGEKVDLNWDQDGFSVESEDGTTMIGGSAMWPEDMPPEVPELGKGDITSTTFTGSGDEKTWIVGYENLPGDCMEIYKAKLIDAGWTIETETKSIMESLQATYGDEYDISVTYDEEFDYFTIIVSNQYWK